MGGLFSKYFGPSKEEVWRKLAAEMEGQFVKGGFFGRDKVDIQHEDWLIRLETKAVSTGKVVVIYTLLSAVFHNPDKFRFRVTRRNIFTDIGKFFGMQDMEVGDPVFDEAFIIQGKNEEKVRRLLANSGIRELLNELPEVHFEVKPKEDIFSSALPEGREILMFRRLGDIKDLEQLKKLYNLFALTLDQLSRL